jgi:hypothetical protein
LAIKSNYDDCPTKCERARKRWDYERREYCGECPHKREQEVFKAEADEVFQERFGHTNYNFHKLYQAVIEIAGLEKKKRLSLYSTALLNTFLNEKWKYNRYKDAKKPNG